MPWFAWLVIVLAALAIAARVARWLTFWAWVRSIKDPKGRMEAEILWRNYRRSGRRKRLWYPENAQYVAARMATMRPGVVTDEWLQAGLQRGAEPVLRGRESRRPGRRGDGRGGERPGRPGPGEVGIGHVHARLPRRPRRGSVMGRLDEHLNSAEYWLEQADIYDFPNPIRTECLQLAAIHASLAQALAAQYDANRANHQVTER